ncbi:glutathione hydrolase 6 [Mixophyes fleayi]|uniref:glutathione hydrolase 6 n=1 Tax=Mixophyes fleayi TaxID=3061075 RepID=UPI003F4E2887
MSPLREEIRYQRVQEAEGEDREEVTVYLYSHSSRSAVRCRETCPRIFSSILLLAVAVGFVLYELEYGSLEPPQAQNSSQWENLSPHTHHHQSETHDHSEEHGSHHHGEPEDDESHSSDTYHRAVVVSDSETCSTVARDLLQSGGSVVDAGIAAVLCLAVVHPHTTSLGGIFSSIYFNRTSMNASVLNAIPKEASPTKYGIPQVLQGLRLLHQQHGKKLWSELLSAAIILANQGFLVDTNLHAALENNKNIVLSSVGLCHLFCDQKNNLKGVGATVENTLLGKVLEQVMNVMTDSVLPDVLIHSLQSDIEVTERERFTEAISREHLTSENPLTFHLDDLTIFSPSVPTAGKILSESVREIYNHKHEFTSDRSSEILMNSTKNMYIMGGAWPRDPSANSSSLPPWNPAPVGSNVLIANSDGDVFVVSLTLNSTFGSGFVSPSTGILLSDFVQGSESTQGSSPTFWACPSVLLFGTDIDVIGLAASGGSSVPFSLAQLIFSHVFLQEDLAESVNETSVDLKSVNSDLWLEYLGLQDSKPKSVVALEVYAEHVHVAKSQSLCCYPKGL